MGRVGWEWRKAFLKRGWEFRHVGPAEVGRLPHPAFFPRAARAAYRRGGLTADVILVHEPAGGAFVSLGTPTVVFSHGLERRGWEIALRGPLRYAEPIGWRSRVSFPIWRLRGCDRALRLATGALLINREDAAFAERYYGRSAPSYRVFRNGIDPVPAAPHPRDGRCRVLFLGSWLPRKGTVTLAQAAQRLAEWGVGVDWLLAGTRAPFAVIARDWPQEAASHTEVVPSFDPGQESSLYHRSDILVLPSFFEGQPLSLLQGMAAGLCCIASDCCGQKDFIEPGRNGLLHRPGDAEELAQLIRVAARDERMRSDLGERARLSVQGRDWDVVSAEVVDYVESIAKSRSAGGGARGA